MRPCAACLATTVNHVIRVSKPWQSCQGFFDETPSGLVRQGGAWPGMITASMVRHSICSGIVPDLANQLIDGLQTLDRVKFAQELNLQRCADIQRLCIAIGHPTTLV